MGARSNLAVGDGAFIKVEIINGLKEKVQEFGG
jgi:hypothetical protein